MALGAGQQTVVREVHKESRTSLCSHLVFLLHLGAFVGLKASPFFFLFFLSLSFLCHVFKLVLTLIEC